MSSPTTNTWEDRRALFQRGKEIHEPAPARKMSLPKAVSPPQSPASTTSNESTAAQRRPSGSQGMFGNLTAHKHGSEDYTQRRASIDEMTQKSPFGHGGIFDRFINSSKK